MHQRRQELSLAGIAFVAANFIYAPSDFGADFIPFHRITHGNCQANGFVFGDIEQFFHFFLVKPANHTGSYA